MRGGELDREDQRFPDVLDLVLQGSRLLLTRFLGPMLGWENSGLVHKLLRLLEDAKGQGSLFRVMGLQMGLLGPTEL